MVKTKKYFVVGSPKEEYYPWVMCDEAGDNFLFDSVEDAKKAIADNSWAKSEADDFWIGEKIEYDVDEVNSMRKPFGYGKS